MPILVKRIASSLIAILSLSALLSAQARQSSANSSGLQKYYDAAQHFQQAGNLEEAARQYRAFLSKAQEELALGHAGVGDYAKATTLFDEALALQPDSTALRLEFARVALAMGDASRAGSLMREFLSEGHGDSQSLAEAHQLLGRALLKKNQDQDAKKEMEEAVKLDPSFANGYGLAVVCLDLDDEKCVSQIFQEMERSFGDTPALHMQFGLAYGNSDFVPQAIAEFRKVIAADPKYPHAHYSLAAALLAAGDDAKNIPEAESELKQELTISPNDFFTYAALGKLAVTSHRYDEAENYLKKATQLNPSNPDAFLYLGQMYFDMNRPADAEPALRKAIELTKDPSRNRYQIQKAHFLLGRILMQEHKPDEAHAEMAIAQTFANKGLSHDKSELAGLLSNSAATGAETALDNSKPQAQATPLDESQAARDDLIAYEKRLTPAIADSYNNLGAIAASGQHYAEALKYFEQAARWNPTLDGLDLNWGRAAFMASEFSDAIAPLSRYIAAHPEDTGVSGALAMSQFMTQDYTGCIQTFKGAEDRLVSIPQMEYVFAESLVKTGEIAAGQQRLESIEASHPEIADVHRSLGEVYASRGDTVKAARELKTALVLNANDATAHYDLGKLNIAGGDATAAISELETATKLSPSDPAFHRELAVAYRMASRKDDEAKEIQIYESLKNSAASAQKPSPGPEGGDSAR